VAAGIRTRWTGIASAAVAVALLVLGALSHEWLIGRDLGIETRLGLREVEICQTVDPQASGDGSRSCESVALAAVGESAFAPDGFDRFGSLATASFWAGLGAAAVLVVCLLFSLARWAPDLPIHPTTLGILASAAALALGGVTMLKNPYTALVGWGSGRGFVLYGLGASLGLFGSILLGRARPIAPSEWDAP
jgi:hypothetical protein